MFHGTVCTTSFSPCPDLIWCAWRGWNTDFLELSSPLKFTMQLPQNLIDSGHALGTIGFAILGLLTQRLLPALYSCDSKALLSVEHLFKVKWRFNLCIFQQQPFLCKLKPLIQIRGGRQLLTLLMKISAIVCESHWSCLIFLIIPRSPLSPLKSKV